MIGGGVCRPIVPTTLTVIIEVYDTVVVIVGIFLGIVATITVVIIGRIA